MATCLALTSVLVVIAGCSPAPPPGPGQTPTRVTTLNLQIPTRLPATSTPVPPTSTPVPVKQYNLSMASGESSSSYYPFAKALAELWTRNLQGVKVEVQSSGGSVENLRLLRDQEVDLALVQNDMAYYAWNGSEVFNGSIRDFGAVASLYPELLQWVVTPDITEISQLKGRTIAVGPPASGTEVNTRQVLEANGIAYKDLGKWLMIPLEDAVDAFKRGQVQGFFVTGGVPSPAIAEVAGSQDIGLLPIDGDAAAKVTARYRLLTPARISAGSYDGIQADVPTLSVRAMLVARRDLDVDLVYRLAKVLTEKQAELAQTRPEARGLSNQGAVQALTVPLLPGAEKYYREIGVVK